MFILHKNNSNKYISIPMKGLFSHGLSVMYNARQSRLRGHRDDLTSVSQEEKEQVLALLMSTANSIYDLEIKDTCHVKQR